MGNRLNPSSLRLRIGVLVTTAVLLALALFIGLTRFTTSYQTLLVSGPSMSPTLRGPSRELTCQTCGWSARVLEAGEISPSSPPCFRCGERAGNNLSKLSLGEQVQVLPQDYWFAEPGINDLVAIKKPNGGLQVKRVVAKAGDIVTIDQLGQVFVGDALWRPPFLTTKLDLDDPGIEVYRHSKELGSKSRLQTIDSWLVYEHRNIHNRGLPDLIRDDNPANVRIRRTPLPVQHLFIAMVVDSQSDATLDMVCALGTQPVIKRLKLVSGRQRLVLEFDQDRWKVLDGTELQNETQSEILQVETLGLAPERPIAFRLTSSGQVSLESFWLGRGIRFDPPTELADVWREGVKVAEGRIFVLGDNAPVSEDSRHQPECVDLKDVVGQVVVDAG